MSHRIDKRSLRARTKASARKRKGVHQRRRQIASAIQRLEDRHLLAFDITLFADINQLGISSVPESVVEFNGGAYFVADDGRTGSELWKSDGTAEGTEQVIDLLPGIEGSQPAELTVLGSDLYFIAFDADNEFDLWKTDGTATGTELVFDANANGVYYPGSLTASNTANGPRIFFTAYEQASGYELWATDGTSAGTALVRDINPDQSIIDRPQELTDVNGTLFFTTYDDGYYNRELWKSDGTTAGTVLVKDIGVDFGDPGAADDDYSISSNPYNLTNVNGTLFFAAEDFDNGIELFVSDGSSTGTVMVDDFNPGGGSSYPGDLTSFDNKLFFSATDGSGRHLYSSTGTSIDLVAKTAATGEASNPNNFAVVGNELFFAAEGAVPSSTITATNPVLTPQNSIRTGTTATIAGIITEVTPTPDRGFIGIFSGVNTFTLENTAAIGAAGSLQGVMPGDIYITDIDANELDEDYWDWTVSDPGGLTNINFTGFASGNDMEASGEGLVFELYLGDPDTAPVHATHEVFGASLDLWQGARDEINIALADAGGVGVTSATVRMRMGRIVGGSFVEHLPVGGSEAFVVNAELTADLSAGTTSLQPVGRELHKTNGTTGGTLLVKDIGLNSSSNPSQLTESGGKLFFSADEVAGAGRELWVSDGSSGGTMMLVDSLPGVDSSGAPLDGDPLQLTDVGGTLFFTTLDTLRDRELWTSDGTNTQLVQNINTATQSSEIEQLTEVGGLVYFVANDGVNGEAVWVADPAAGTVTMVADLTPNVSSETISGLTKYQNGVVFYNDSVGTSGAIYYYNGTTSTELALTAPIPFNLNGDMFLEIPGAFGRMYFVSDDGTTGEELWSSTGTTAGTAILQDFISGATGSYPRNLVDSNGSLIFNATDATYGNELFFYEPLSGGIQLFADVNSAGDSNPDQLTVVGNRLYFTAEVGTGGVELWNALGNGVSLVADLNPNGSSSPTNLTNIDGTLYFSADNGTTGREPYATTNGAAPISLGDITPGGGGSNPSGFKDVGGTIYFSASETAVGVQGEAFLGITGTSLASLRGAPNYPAAPDSIQIYSEFESPTNVADNYGIRTRGYLTAPATGDYTFWIASDDNGELLLSTDTDPANATVIANVPSWSSPRQWTKFTQQQSAVISLVEGQHYYIEAEMKEGGGGDNLAVAWSGPGITGPTVITGEYLTPFGATPGNQGSGTELWKTDGSVNSAQLVTDIQSGLPGSDPQVLAATDKRLLFSASGTGTQDRELWASGGTTSTTILIEDLNIGSDFSSDPDEFIQIGDDFFFTADDGLTGTELYRLREFTPVVAQLDVGAEVAVFPPVAQSQRSSLETITLTLDEQVSVSPAMIQLLNRDTNTQVTTFAVNTTIENNQTFVQLTFAPGPSVVERNVAGGYMNSLEDGNYQITVMAAGVESMETGEMMASDMIHGDEAVDMFFRFFGDKDGDRDADTVDLGAFGSTFRLEAADAGYDEDFDLTGDGDVDVADLGEFGSRFRNTLDFI